MVKEENVSDPVQLIGAGALGAFGHYIFMKMVKIVRPNGNGNGSVASELRQMNHRLQNIEGTVRGLDGRIAVLEKGGL